ncbi:MAG: biotin--[acetyl-CoA-carboxylase] ligase [Planctomycetota bacterium]|nr:biotin--[acetyl-CoA-carboxylase] ligase [Planctomycetota bacterium]
MNPYFDTGRIEQDSPAAHVIVLPDCESTNTEALRLVEKTQVPLPCFVGTPCQTAGRGRGSHRWFSSPGALTFSLIDDVADIATQDRGSIGLTVGITIAQILERLVPLDVTVQLKWPNDIFIQEKKLGGILIESAASQPSQIVIGIGLNVNNSLQLAPSDVRQRGIAITDVTGTTIDLTHLVVLLLNQLDQNLALLKSKQLDIPTLWNPRCMLNHSEVSLAQGDLVHQGRCCGVASDGALIINVAGQLRQFYSGVIQE